MSGKHDSSVDEERASNLLLTGPIAIRGLGRGVRGALVRGRPSRHRAFAGGSEQEVAPTPLQRMLATGPTVTEGGPSSVLADHPSTQAADATSASFPSGAEVSETGDDGLQEDRVPERVENRASADDDVLQPGAGEQDDDRETVDDRAGGVPSGDEVRAREADQVEPGTRGGAVQSAAVQDDAAASSATVPDAVPELNAVLPEDDRTEAVDAPADERRSGPDEAGDDPAPRAALESADRPGADDGSSGLHGSVVTEDPSEVVHGDRAIEASASDRPEQAADDAEGMHLLEGGPAEPAALDSTSSLDEEEPEPVETPGASALQAAGHPSATAADEETDRARKDEGPAAETERGVDDAGSARESDAPDDVGPERPDPPQSVRRWSTAEELYSLPPSLDVQRHEQVESALDVDGATTGDAETLEQIEPRGADAESESLPVVEPAPGTHAGDPGDSARREPAVGGAPAPPGPPSPRGSSSTVLRVRSSPGRRPLTERLGRGAIGIAVLVGLALVCAGLVTAVVLKARNDAAIAAREAAHYTPPPLATVQPVDGGPVVAVIGDGSTSTAAAGVASKQRWTALLGSSLHGTVHADAADGMGYVAKSGSGDTFVRAASRVPSNASVVVFFGGSADSQVAPPSVAKAATDAYAAAKKQAPDAKILVVGPAITSGDATTDLVMIRDALRSAAALVDAQWVDPIDRGWLPVARQSVSPGDLSASDETAIAAEMQDAVTKASG